MTVGDRSRSSPGNHGSVHEQTGADAEHEDRSVVVAAQHAPGSTHEVPSSNVRSLQQSCGWL